MAITNDNIVYIKDNVLPALTSWTLDKASISGNNIVIQPGGTATAKLSNDLNKGLKVSRYRQLVVEIIDPKINETYNYQNIVETVFKIIYLDDYGTLSRGHQCIPLTQYKSEQGAGGSTKITRDITMENIELQEGTVIVKNNSDHNITLVSCIMFRSNELVGQFGDLGSGGGGGGGPILPPGPVSQLTLAADKWDIDGINDKLLLTALFPSDMPGYYKSGNTYYYNFYFEFYPVEATSKVLIASQTFGHDTSYRGYLTTKDFSHSEYINNWYIYGVRDGQIKVRLVYMTNKSSVPASNKHDGEYIEQIITVKNCDPAQWVIDFDDGGNSVNGFEGTHFHIKQSRPWYSGLWYNLNPDLHYALYENEINSRKDKFDFSSRLLDSVNGGQCTFSSDSYNISSASDGFDIRYILYGIWNGTQNIGIKSRDYSNSGDIWETIIPLRITGCEHEDVLSASINKIDKNNKQVTITVVSTKGRPPINTNIQPSNVHGIWNLYPDNIVKTVTSTYGKIRNPYILLELTNFDYNGKLQVYTFVQKNALESEYREIFIDVSLGDVGVGFESNTGSFIIKEPGATILITILGLTLTRYANVVTYNVNGGTIAVTKTAWTQFTVEARKPGKVLIEASDDVGHSGTLEITNDYQDWADSIELKSTTDTFTTKQKGEQLQLYLTKWNSNLNVSISQITLDGGTVTLGRFDSGSRSFTVTANNKGRCQIIVTCTDNNIDFIRTVEVNNDYE